MCTLLFSGAFGGNGVSIKTIVIDPGHGGKDPGAIGPGKTNEKDVALAVALKLGEYIKNNFPDVNIIYTRTTDVFVELHERADMANKAKADLFIAIHCNSNPSPQFYGTSTYVLGLHRTEANLEVAKRENSVILLEGDRDKNYEFDPNTPEGNIIMSMKQNAFLDQSIDMASKIENEFETAAKRKSMGVKQAGFYVLYKTTMPSLLSEIGFVSNREEEKFLTSAKGQDLIASALFKAFRDYKLEMENGQLVATAKKQNPAPPPVEPQPITPKEEVKQEPVPPSSDNNAPVKSGTPSNSVEIKTPDTASAAIAQKTEPPKPEKKITPPEPVDTTVVILASGIKIKKPVENTGGGGITPKPVTIKPTVQPVVAANDKKQATDNQAANKKTAPDTVATSPPVVAEKKKAPENTADKKPATKKQPPAPDTAVTAHVTGAKQVNPNPTVAAIRPPVEGSTSGGGTYIRKAAVKNIPAADTSAAVAMAPPKKTQEPKPVEEKKTTAENKSPEPVSNKTKPEVAENTKTTNEAPSETAPVTNGKKQAGNKETSAGNKQVADAGTAKKTEKPVEAAPKSEANNSPKESKTVVIPPAPPASGIVLKVQLFALKVELKKAEHDKIERLFKTITTETLANGFTRYFGGQVHTYAEAAALLQIAQSQGYKDAFIVGYKNGERLSPSQLKTLESH